MMMMSQTRNNPIESTSSSSFVLGSNVSQASGAIFRQSSDKDHNFSANQSSPDRGLNEDQPENELTKPVDYSSPSQSPINTVSSTDSAKLQVDDRNCTEARDFSKIENGEVLTDRKMSSNNLNENGSTSTKKRARVENIVTNIMARDRSHGDRTPQSMDGDDGDNAMMTSYRGKVQQGKNQKKKISSESLHRSEFFVFPTHDLKLREQQISEKITSLISGFQGNKLAASEALNLVLANQRRADDVTASPPYYDDVVNDDWSPAIKKPRFNRKYQAKVRVSTVANGDDDVINHLVDYGTLVESLKRELMNAVETIAECSARRVLERLSSKKKSGDDVINKDLTTKTVDDSSKCRDVATSSRSPEVGEQTDALSLVIKSRASSSSSATPSPKRSVTPYDDDVTVDNDNMTSSASMKLSDKYASLVRCIEKSTVMTSESGEKSNGRGSAFWAPMKRDSEHSPVTIATSSDTSSVETSSTVFAQRSFLHHLHQHPWQPNSLATVLARQQQQQQQLDSSALLWQARQTPEFKLNAAAAAASQLPPILKTQQSMTSQFAASPFLGRSHLASPFYLPLPVSATSQSPPGFSSSQLNFPLLQNFPQGAFVNALANSECRRIRTADQSIGRSVSARTTTREPGKHRQDYSSGSLDVSPYSTASIQEGLTPQHLKKAKLMFFYTRYPSANTLKTYFSDVKFTRATTSQLIKWFSNFREFYYIQMEKFARQALTEGITDSSLLCVSRNGELFRALNLHYNKSNEFRVADRFLDVTNTSLREFFMAIQSGKDHEPSWKKVIYKVICKLDQDIPEIFKSPNVLDRLDEIVE